MKIARKVLITGGSGFIGTHLCRRLLEEGNAVTVVDLEEPSSELTRVQYVKMDVNHTLEFQKILKQGWDAVYHFAAIVSVPECEQTPELSFKTNTESFQTLVEFCRDQKVRSELTPQVFFASSAAVYGDLCTPNHKLTEKELLPVPQSFYGLHKYLSEQSLRLYCRNFGLRGLSFRFFNVYGPGQKQDSVYSGVISKFKHALETNGSVNLYNHGKNERDFIHVEDIVSACIMALDIDPAQLDGSPVNLCTGNAISIQSVFDEMSKISGKTIHSELMPARPGDIEFSCGDPSLAQSLLKSWQPRRFHP